MMKQEVAKMPYIRVGFGVDMHAFSKTANPEAFITLGGVKINHLYKLKAHSDGDVLLHAVTDALLGSVAAGSIGEHFPNSDPQWKDAPSSIFIKHACKALGKKGAVIQNIDVTVLCESPQIMPYADSMRKNIANLLKCTIEEVNIKATTDEKMGFIHKKDGVTAFAICSVLVSPAKESTATVTNEENGE